MTVAVHSEISDQYSVIRNRPFRHYMHKFMERTMFVQRIRVRFQKLGEMAFISHLDLMRTFERALRRTGLPLRMTEGFNPHPRLSFPAALGLGIEGLDEAMEFDLADWVTPSDVEQRLREQLPAGLNPLSIKLADPQQTAQVREVAYRAEPVSPALAEDSRLSAEAVAALIAQPELTVERHRKGRDKSVNIRPFLIAAERDGVGLTMKFKAGPEGSVHPEEVLGLLGFDAQERRSGFKLMRTRVMLAN